jgi:hypothetical protein
MATAHIGEGRLIPLVQISRRGAHPAFQGTVAADHRSAFGLANPFQAFPSFQKQQSERSKFDLSH